MFYFVRLLPYLFLPSCCVLSSFSLCSFFFSLSRIPLLVSPFLSRFVSFRLPARTSSSTSSSFVARSRTLCRLGPEQFFFCYFIQLFREREESFYYLDARLQCLVDNKPMKATFELEGPLKSPFSPTSRFLSRSLTLAFSLPLVPVLSHVSILILFSSVADLVPFLRLSSSNARRENFAPLFCFLSALRSYFSL